MKKLVILYPAHYEQIMGGAELQIFYLVENAKKIGYKIFYIYVDNGKVIKNADDVILYPLTSSMLRFRSKWFQFRKKIKKILNEIQPDIIYTRYTSSWCGFAAIYAKKNKVKHIHALASDKAPDIKISLKIFFHPSKIAEFLYMSRGLQIATEVIAQNKFQQELLLKNFCRRGILINQMTPFVKDVNIIKHDSPILVLWIGNLKNIKRPEIFIELAQILDHFNITHRMIMIGRPSKKYEYLLKCAVNNLSNFEFKGEISQDHVNNLLLESHILVNTSEFEGFSNTFVQAWMRKVPVISMHSNPNEAITKNMLGFVAPEFQDLVEFTKELIANADLRKSMGENAYTYAVLNHTLEKNISEIFSLI